VSGIVKSDIEVICDFMKQFYQWPQRPEPKWLRDQDLNLVTLWEVQDRLTEHQWTLYTKQFKMSTSRDFLSLTAVKKIAALADILR